MNTSINTIILWIQNTPDTYQTVLSYNGKQLKSGTSEYIKVFENLTSINLEKYTVLTNTLRRLNLHFQKHRSTFISGHFQQTDKSNRKICYRALIIDAKNKEEECHLLVKEASLYGCSISEEDKIALKKKRICSKIVVILLIVIIIISSLWILNSSKILSFFNTMN